MECFTFMWKWAKSRLMILRIENDEKYAARRNSIYCSALVSMKQDTGVLSDCLQSTITIATRSDIGNFRVQVIQFLDESGWVVPQELVRTRHCGRTVYLPAIVTRRHTFYSDWNFSIRLNGKIRKTLSWQVVALKKHLKRPRESLKKNNFTCNLHTNKPARNFILLAKKWEALHGFTVLVALLWVTPILTQ